MSGQRELLWNAGEQIGETDLNLMQRYMRAHMSDHFFGTIGQTSHGFTPAKTDHLFVMGDSLSPIPHSVTARVVQVFGGLCAQWRTGSQNINNDFPADFGNDPYCLQYYAGVNEFQTTHDVGGANPRWDLVTLTLDTISNDAADQESRSIQTIVGSSRVTTSQSVYKKRKVRAIVTVTKGTEAVTPNVPARPAGSVPLYALYVPASWNAIVDPLNIWDLRMPVGSFCVDLVARDFSERLAGANLGSVVNGNGVYGSVRGGAVNAELYLVVMGRQQHCARLLGVSALIGSNMLSADFNLKRFNSLNYGSTLSNIPAQSGSSFPNTSTALRGNPSGSNTEYRTSQLSLNPDTNSSAGLNNFPIWINGHTSAYAQRPDRQAAGTDNTLDRVGLQVIFGDVAGLLSLVRFHFAGGL